MKSLISSVSCTHSILSEDDLNLLEIPEPPTVNSKMDNRSSCGSGSMIVSGERKQLTSAKPMQCKSMQQQHHHHHCHLSTQIENASHLNDTIQTASTDGKVSMNDLRNTIQKLENVNNYCFDISFVDHFKEKFFFFIHQELSEAKSNSDSLKRMNVTLKEKLTDEVVGKRLDENVELIEMRRTMTECENELRELRQQYLLLKCKAETELNEEHIKIGELTRVVESEMDKNRSLMNELSVLRDATNIIESIKNETVRILV